MLNLADSGGKSPVKRLEQSFGQKSARETRWSLPTLGRLLTCKKERKKSEHWKPVKDKYNLNRFPSTIPKYWKVICIQKRKRNWKDSVSSIVKVGIKLFLYALVQRLRHFSQVREKERKKKEKEKRTVERHFCLMRSCWLNILLYCKKERERKKNFRKSHHYLFVKLCSILNAPLCWNLLVVLFPLSISLLLHVSVSASYRFH